MRDADQHGREDTLSNLQYLRNLTGDIRKVEKDANNVYLKVGETYGEAEVYANSVTLKLRSLTMAQASAIIEALK